MGGAASTSFFSYSSNTPCRDLVISSQLIAPNYTVLQQVNEGDFLTLHLQSPKGPVLTRFGNEIVGTVMTKEIVRLIQCLGKGEEFLAKVRTIEGGLCAITIKSKAKWEELF